MTEIMQMVIDKLGVKVEKEFEIIDRRNGYVNDYLFHFDKFGNLTDERGVCDYHTLLSDLLHDKCFIRKLSFKPQRAEQYYFINQDGEIVRESWVNYEIDYYRFNACNCFKTEEEITPEDKKRIVTEMKREYENG